MQKFEQSFFKESNSTLIDYSEEAFRVAFADKTTVDLSAYVEGLNKFISNLQPNLKKANDYLNEQPRKVMVGSARDLIRDNRIRLEELKSLGESAGMPGLVNMIPSIVAEYEKCEKLQRIMSDSIATAKKLVGFANQIIDERNSLSAKIAKVFK